MAALLPVTLLGVDEAPALERACAAEGRVVRRVKFSAAASEVFEDPFAVIVVAQRLLCEPRVQELLRESPERAVVLGDGGTVPRVACEVVQLPPEQVVAAIGRASTLVIAQCLARHRAEHPEAQLILRGRPPRVVTATGVVSLIERAPLVLDALHNHARSAELLANGGTESTAGEIGLPDGAAGWMLIGFELVPLFSLDASCFSLKLQDRKQEWLAALQRDRSRRFDDLATLAGNLAHDFNNLLQVITTQAELIALDAGDQHPDLRHALAQIERAAEQGTQLTRRVLAFSRARPLVYEDVDLRELAREALQAFASHRKIPVEIRLCETPALVAADRVQLRQAICELIRAVTSSGPVALAVTCTLPAGLMAPGRRPHAQLRLRMPCPQDLALLGGEILLDPLESIDHDTIGPDLGSALAYRVVHTHGGRIKADLDGSDLVIRIVLPLLGGGGTAPPKLRPRGAVLLVDDDPAVLAAGEALFERQGFVTLTAKNGSDALEVLQRRGPEISLAVLDLIMPGLPTAELILKLRHDYPHVRVLVATGYGLGAHTLPPVDGLLQKPFHMEDLERLLARSSRALGEETSAL
ncbi:MAG: response regulator [Planctomycetota bacterium]